MTPHVEAHLPEYALGLLEGGTRSRVEVHVTHCGPCGAWLQELRESAAGSVQPTIDPAIEGPLEELAPAIAELFDLDDAALATVIDRIAHGKWHPGPVEGLEFQPVRGGPRVAQCGALLLRGGPGATFPHHAHAGDELTLVLQGGLGEESGSRFWRGQLMVKQPGSEHALQVLEGPTCIVALLAQM